MDKLRIVFMGTPEFAVASLDILVKNNYSIVGVVTMPDKPAGRGQQMHYSAVKEYAVANKLHLLQPEKLKDPLFIQQLKELKADLQIVVTFRMLPESVWSMPRLGTVNLHGSLLPQYRGAAPINWAIINGEKETGVTTFFLQHEIDTGKIIYREKIPIGENDTAGDIHDKLMHVGAALILKTVQSIEKNNYPQTDQLELIEKNEEIKHAPKIFKEDCAINWSRSVDEIHNFIRGLSPYPTAFTNFISPEGKLFSVKIFATRVEKAEQNLSQLSISSDGKTCIKIVVKGGFIRIEELQLAGKKRMSVSEFLRGFQLVEGWRVG